MGDCTGLLHGIRKEKTASREEAFPARHKKDSWQIKAVGGYPQVMSPVPWRVSLHGGHSGEFCEHATGTLRGILEAAVAGGFSTFGVSEHAPRTEPRFLYETERAKGYSVKRLQREFEAYSEASLRLQEEFRGRLSVLRGFEAEVVPSLNYAETMRAIRSQHDFDYTVGSVHHVGEISIDESAALFRAAVDACGGLEPLLVSYYGLVRDMIEELRPEIVAHLDLPKLHAPAGADLATPRVRRAAKEAVDVARNRNCILDLNTASWRKGLGEPYPAPWLVHLATEAGVPFCFGDDSHSAAQVGFGIERARQYLLEHGVDSVTCLAYRGRRVTRRRIRLRA